MPASDDVTLVADVVRPGGAGRWPAIVVRTPYGRNTTASRGLQVNALALAEAGYAVVIQDVRGRGESNGTFEPFVHEAADGVTTIEWTAAQPWCNGRVGTAGISYLAYTQLAAATRAPEPLQAWVPGLTPNDVRTTWVRHRGVPNDGFNRAWLAALDMPDAPTLLDPYDERVPSERDLSRAPPLAPALVIAGHYDVFHHGSFDLYAGLGAGSAGHRLLAGPWAHTGLPLGRRAGDRDFGIDAVIDLHEVQQEWFDRHLRDDGEVLPTSRIFFSGWDRWETVGAWPPPATPCLLYPDHRGSLADDVPTAGTVGVVVTADDPTPAIGGRVYPWEPVLRPGAFDQASRRGRSDVLAWSSGPVLDPLVVAGPVRCVLDASGPGYVVVTVTDVDETGRAWNIADGAAMLPPDGVTEVDLGHVAHAFIRGHAIGFDVGFSAVPRFGQPTAGPRHVTLGPVTRLELPRIG